MGKEFHKDPFSEETLTKLRLYQAYIHNWLPVFMSGGAYVNEIWIFDLFCGPGCDCNDVDGSPIILLKELKRYMNFTSTKNTVPINILFNDKTKWKIKHLKNNISNIDDISQIIKIYYENKEYSSIFNNVAKIASRKSNASFLFIDQCGVNAIKPEYIRQLTSFPKTDWLAFVASSQARRFLDHESIQSPPIKKGDKWHDAHRDIATACRTIIDDPEYYIVPFSIKKKGNIHGLLFGSGHPLGAEKFINACWSEDVNAGEANFHIDGIIQNTSRLLSLLPSKKLEVFKDVLWEKIETQKLKNTLEIYKFALHSGVKASHAKKVLTQMKKGGVISKIPPLSYSSTILKNNVEPIILLG